MLADSPKPEAYHSQPGLDKYFQHYVMLGLTTIIVMFTSITVIIFASMIIKSIYKLKTMSTCCYYNSSQRQACHWVITQFHCLFVVIFIIFIISAIFTTIPTIIMIIPTIFIITIKAAPVINAKLAGVAERQEAKSGGICFHQLGWFSLIFSSPLVANTSAGEYKIEPLFFRARWQHQGKARQEISAPQRGLFQNSEWPKNFKNIH